MDNWLLSAAGFSTLIFLVHYFAGGREIVPSLLAAKDIGRISKFTNYYCWHLVSITLASLAIAFTWAGLDTSQSALAIMATGLSGLFCLWSLAMIYIHKLKLWHFPQWALFIPPTILGFIALI